VQSPRLASFTSRVHNATGCNREREKERKREREREREKESASRSVLLAGNALETKVTSEIRLRRYLATIIWRDDARFSLFDTSLICRVRSSLSKDELAGEERRKMIKFTCAHCQYEDGRPPASHFCPLDPLVRSCEQTKRSLKSGSFRRAEIFSR